MWEMEGRSTSEIAAELGIKESAVRHTVSRARASLRRVLSELVIDEERGLTALDMLSTTYKKASELAQKSSKVALSLLLVVTAFLGFNSMTGREGVVINPSAPSEIASGPIAGSAEAVAPAEASAPTPEVSMPAKKSSTMVSGVAIKSAKLAFPGLDKEGIPTGFTVATDDGALGTMRVNRNTPIATEAGTELSTQAITAVGGPNVMISQNITVDGNGTRYSVDGISVGVEGSWTQLKLGATTADFERMSNGQYLLTVRILVVSTPSSEFYIPVGNRGFDLTGPIKSITTRLVLNPGKTQILSQSVLVTELKK